MARETVWNKCLNLRVRRAARNLVRRYDAAFRPAGITSVQFSLLTLVSEDAVPGMAEIARALAMDRTTVLAALKPLEVAGLLKVSENPADRRGRLVHLTEQGRETLDQAGPLWEAVQAQVSSLLASPEFDALAR